VRFLRNAIVAKVSGSDSSLLQISSDERSRVARAAELFSEEDLARHLQIMLRTHAELGYRQEQRFHLELGLLKMAHAQRLLPLEQLLSGVEPVAAPDRKLSAVPEPKKASDISAAPKPFVSPFAADSARKGTPRLESTNETPVSAPRPSPAAISGPSVVMGSAAPAAAFERGPEPIAKAASANVEDVRLAVLNALGSSGLNMLSSMLESGEWKIDGNELSIRVAASPALIEMSVSNEGKKIVIASASGSMGRPMKLQILSGGSPQTAASRSAPPAPNGSSRGRAEQEPVIQRLREKFGAEIRTVIDYKQKR
jgi:DNA polymerase-3 subunit gamma/tau